MPSGVFVFRYLRRPEFLSPKEVRGRILRTLQLQGDAMLVDFEKTVATWNDPATFRVKVRYAGSKARVAVLTDDDKWKWLNHGTSERWAVMSRDWQSKTRVGQLQSGVGQSKVVLRGKKNMAQARPGIEARGWSRIIKEKHQDNIREAVREALVEGLRVARSRGTI